MVLLWRVKDSLQESVPPPTMWVLGIEFRLSVYMASAFTCRAFLLTPCVNSVKLLKTKKEICVRFPPGSVHTISIKEMTFCLDLSPILQIRVYVCMLPNPKPLNSRMFLVRAFLTRDSQLYIVSEFSLVSSDDQAHSATS